MTPAVIRIKSQAQGLTQMGHIRGIPVHQGAGHYRKDHSGIGSVVNEIGQEPRFVMAFFWFKGFGWASSTGSGLARALQNP